MNETIELTPTYSELNDLKSHVKRGGPRPFRPAQSAAAMTTPETTRSASLRRVLGIAAVVAASVTVVAAGVINAGAESASHPAYATANQQQIAELKAIEDWARSEGLTGLSPASLHPINQQEIAELKAIAEWARVQGLTGLSPASLHPIDPD